MTIESVYPPFPINTEVPPQESACHYRGHWFQPWSGKVPRALEQLSLCIATAEATRAQVLQLLKPADPRAHALQQEKPLQWQTRTPQLESRPHSLQPEKARVQQPRPSAAK